MSDLNKLSAHEVARIPFFFDVTGEDLQELTDMLTVRKIEPNRYVFKEGDEQLGMFFILDGSVKIKKKNNQGDEDLLANLNAPQILGETALVDRARRYFSAITLTELTVAELTCENFDKLIITNPELAVHIVRKIAHSFSLRLKKTGSMFA